MANNSKAGKQAETPQENSFLKSPLGTIIKVLGLTTALLSIIQFLYIQPIKDKNAGLKEDIASLTCKNKEVTDQLAICQQNLKKTGPTCDGFTSPAVFSALLGNNLIPGQQVNDFKAWGNENSKSCLVAKIYTDQTRGEILGIDYDVLKNDYAVWQVELNKIDISGFKYLTFYVKGLIGHEKVNTHLISNNNDGQKVANAWVSVGKYCQISRNWQKVTIPISQFITKSPKFDTKHVDLIQFAFEYEVIKGTIFIDDINLE